MIRIVAGTTSGGAALVVREGITSPDQLSGTVLATPQLGNTQDVALRAWLLEQGYETDLEGGGADPRKRDQLTLGLLQDRQRQRARTRREIEHALGQPFVSPVRAGA